METEANETTADRPEVYGFLGPVLMIAMLVIAFVGASVGWIDLADSAIQTELGLTTIILLIAGVFGLAARPTISSSLGGVGTTAVVVLVGAVMVFVGQSIDQTILCLIGAITLIVVHLLERSGRTEEANLAVGAITGFMLALALGASASIAEGGNGNVTYSLDDAHRAYSMTVFMSFWLLSLVLSVVLVTILRGRTQFISPGTGRWFQGLPEVISKDVPIAFGAWALLHVISLFTIKQLPDTDLYNIGVYLGNWWAVGIGVFILLVAYLRTEGWAVVSGLVAVNLVMYTLGFMQENTMINEFIKSNESLTDTFNLWFTDTRGVMMWFSLWFFLNFAVVAAGRRGRFGPVAYRREPGLASKWVGRNGYPLVVGAALVFGLMIRVVWNILPAMNGSGTGLWDMTGGSDPWYMKRAVDYVVMHQSHFIMDADRYYPLGGVNPRPPLFTWSLALGGLAINAITGIELETAVWYSVVAMPAVFGALIVLPVAASARTLHSKTAGGIAAWLIALMPSHVGHSTLGLADHDAFVILFISTAFYFWIRTVQTIDDSKLLKQSGINPKFLFKGIQESWKVSPQTMVLSTLAGMSFATTGLGWKGFVYGPGIVFLIFAIQILLNMFRRRDSMMLTAASINMMLITLLMVVPVYGHNQLNLLFDPSGLQPMFYIAGLTIGLGWVATSFRDKPWLLVLGATVVLASTFVGILALLQFVLKVYNGWDILFTGGYYFSANKIFGTIAEAQAPNRATLFASYGPVVTIMAVSYAVRGIWVGLRRNDQSEMFLGGWVVIAAYMAWSAGRFIFNATPAMAIAGGISIVMLWKAVGSAEFVRAWRRKGTSTPGARIKSVGSAARASPMVPAVFLVFLLVASQHMTYGLDSAIPRGSEEKADVDFAFHNLPPEIFRTPIPFTSLSLLSSSYPETGTTAYDAYCQGCRYMGTFGPGFNGQDWNRAYEWLANQDSDVSFSERPAFVSWWDYGFQALAQGQHPSVSDNFQSGIPATGNMLLADSQEDLLMLFIINLAMGDLVYNGGSFSNDFISSLTPHLSNNQIDELYDVISVGDDSEFFLARSMSVIESSDDTYLLNGHHLDANGFNDLTEVWEVHHNGEVISEPDSSESAAWSSFNITVGTSAERSNETSHYVIGGYWYTSDILEGLSDPSTALHRQNARFALARQMLQSSLDLESLVDVYHRITNNVEYTVPSYEGGPGETLNRNHDIRYFAVDNRLYPVGGLYNAMAGYHSYNPTGIFYAPTTLSGLDPNMYIKSVYQTQRGDGPVIPRTQAEYEDEYLLDMTKQASGATVDPIELVDIDYQQRDDFFETMVARTYVGYGSTSLGLSGSPSQPGQQFGGSKQYGTPDSVLQFARPLPGAMMNHFVIANWYDDGTGEPDTNNNSVPDIHENVGYANTGTKILKYYSGATLTGTVELGDFGVVPNARLLIERDAFSGEEEVQNNGEVIDSDPRDWWVPIGSVDADENGEFSFIVPAGRIRVTAMTGIVDLQSDRDAITSAKGNQNAWNTWDGDLLSPTANGVRMVNPITGILANVSGQQWLGETFVNVSGAAGHSNGEEVVDVSIVVEASGVTGQIVFAGHNDFEGDPVAELDIEITNIWDEVDSDGYSLRTSNGTITGEDLRFTGEGEAMFTGPGQVVASGTISVSEFTGNYTRAILDGHSFTGNGVFEGIGELIGTVFYENGTEVSNPVACNNATIPNGEFVCLMNGTADEYQIVGKVNADGRFTSNGTALFTTFMDRRSFTGTGSFMIDDSDSTLDHYGIFNGSGTFVGTGTFSGDMVKPGSFHLIDAIPGEYIVEVTYPNGETSVIPQPLVVQNEPTEGVVLPVPAGHVSGIIENENGTALPGRVHLVGPNDSASDTSVPCEEAGYAPCWIDTDENGSFAFGPVTKGNYSLLVDSDMDGFSETFRMFMVNDDDAQNITLDDPISTFHDIHFHLFDDGVPVELEEGDSINFTNAYLDNMDPVVALYDENTQMYNVEMPPGVWSVTHALNGTKQFFSEFDFTDVNSGPQDITTQFNYVESTTVTGYLTYVQDANKPEADLIPLSNGIEVTAHWGSIDVSALTDSNGMFSMLLPVGVEANFTFLTVSSQMTVSEKHIVVQDMVLNLTAEPSYVIGGSVDMNRIGNQYDIGIIDFRPIQVVATSPEHSGSFVFDVTPDGRFNGRILPGTWTLDVPDERMNVTSLIVNHTDTNESYDIMAYPENITVDVHIFTDHSLDRNETNGTMRTVGFQLVPIEGSTHGVVVEVLENGTEWISDGVARISVEAGAYRVVIGQQDPLDPNSTVWNTGFVGDIPEGVYGLSNGTEQLVVPLSPEWLTHVNLTNQSGGQVAQRIVTFTSVDDSSTSFTKYVNESGVISDYLPEGDWIVSVDPYISGSDQMAVYRGLVSIEESNAPVDLSIQTVTSAHYQINLTDASNDQALQSYVLTANSDDGLGEITLSSTGDDGIVDVHLMPGNWSVSLNRTDGQTRWIIDDISIGDLSSSNGSEEISVEAERWVNLGGNLFWDLNSDDMYDSNEGVGGTNVTITDNSTGESVVVVSNEQGTWSEFVQVQRNFTISAAKEGFSSNQEFVEIDIDTVSIDLEMTAALVSVSGLVDILPAERWDEISSSTSIVLYPGIGFERQSVSPDLVIEDGNWTGEWSATIEPGDWVVYVVHDSADLSESQVGIAALDASISNGGEVNITLENAGKIRIGTQWTDFDGSQYSLANTSVSGAEMISSPFVSLNLISKGAGWNMTVDSSGGIEMLMPSGTVSMESEFHTTERDTVMEYSAGQSVTVGESQESPLSILEFNRRDDNSLNITVVNVVGEGTELDGAEDVVLLPSGISYDPVTFTFNVDFEGTSAVETYTVSADIVGSDSTFWTLEIRNESISDESAEGAWNSTWDIEMGLEDGMDQSREITLRVTGPNQSASRHADLGHALNIRLTASDTSVYNERVTVRVPQTHDIGFDESSLQPVYGVKPGDTTRIEMTIENNGNGDDTVAVNLTSLAPSDWNVLGASAITMSADSLQTYTFDVIVPSNASAGKYDLTLRLTSEDGITTSNRTIEVQVARPIISIVDDSWTTESSTPPLAGQVTEVFVSVQNSGIVDATGVVLEAVLKEGPDSAPIESSRLSDSMDIPAGEIVNYSFMVDYSDWNSGESPWLEFTVNSSGQIFDDPQPVPEYFTESLAAPGAESTSTWLPLLVILIVGFILYGATKIRGGRRPF